MYCPEPALPHCPPLVAGNPNCGDQFPSTRGRYKRNFYRTKLARNSFSTDDEKIWVSPTAKL